MCRYLNICGDITDDGLMWMLWVIKKNLKPARHPDATSVDDHDEGDNFINIEDEEEEIDQVEIDETVIEPLQQPSITTHSNRKSSSFQYLLPESFSPEQKNAFDTLSSSTAINPLNVIAMSSQSSIDSSVVPPKLMGTTITYQFVTAFHNDRKLIEIPSFYHK
ncbi:hypothetical protein GYH30_030949 [Glycine max]|nr:hypothetical protein GYH30_030949 [Glycine max]